ncbi:MAG: hypothetical protein ACI8QS_002256 [Planctomycetota bacterium]|jgi:hypothetical protein
MRELRVELWHSVDLQVPGVCVYSSHILDEKGDWIEATEFLDKSYGAEPHAQRVSEILLRPIVFRPRCPLQKRLGNTFQLVIAQMTAKRGARPSFPGLDR